MPFTGRIAILVVFFLITSGITHAQSLYGSGGLFLNPTADFMERGKLVPSMLVIPQEGSPAGFGERTLTLNSLSYSVTDRIEAGVIYLKVNPGRAPFSDGSLGGSIKYKLWEQSRGLHPVVAIGISQAGGGDVNQRTAFVALRLNAQSKKTRHPAHIHLGLFYADKYYGFNRDEAVPYAGIGVNVARNLDAFAEIRAKMGSKAAQPPLNGFDGRDLKAPVAVGVAWQASGDLKLAIAYANNGWSRNPKLSFGIGYTFGSRRSR